MAIVGGLDVHRAQITFDYLDMDTGEVHTGRTGPACREEFRRFLERFKGQSDVAFALEGGTGWLFVAEELAVGGYQGLLADPAEAAARASRKHRAKTDRADARRLRELVMAGAVPLSWVPPAHVVEVRTLARLYLDLLGNRNGWCQRIQATLFHHGCPPVGRDLLAAEHRLAAERMALGLPGAARTAVEAGFEVIDTVQARLEAVADELRGVARRQAGCRALHQSQFGIGLLTAPIIWAEMGDCRRFSSSDQAVRHTGLDITVYSSDGKRTAGHLARQGPPALRWALYEAAKCAARTAAPDHAYYHHVRERRGSGRATLSVARKIARRCYHILRALGDDAWAPVD
ncbi:MAG: IS110 family transposase [Actinobacteria bacterium]|nr:IS110 family transposase [Actinomycetota bacterium]